MKINNNQLEMSQENAEKILKFSKYWDIIYLSFFPALIVLGILGFGLFYICIHM